MCGFDVVGFELLEAHALNFPSRDEREWIPGLGWLRHTMSVEIGDFFEVELSSFQVATASPPCSPFT